MTKDVFYTLLERGGHCAAPLKPVDVEGSNMADKVKLMI